MGSSYSFRGNIFLFSILEEGIFKGELRGMLKQIFYILASLIGANLAVNSIELLQNGENISIDE